MAARICSKVIASVAILSAHVALAQDKTWELTAAGKSVLQDKITAIDRQKDRPGAAKSETFPLPTCMFAGGLCGAVHRDGTVAVLPLYDWVGAFSNNRAAVRVGGLYGFVDEEGREVVKPQYRIVDDYKFGFAQVDVDGKSGLIDRDGEMVMEPKYGFIQAIARDRFVVSERRQLGGMAGGEDFSGTKVTLTASGGVSVIGVFLGSDFTEPAIATDVIDILGQPIGPPRPSLSSGSDSLSSGFDKDDPSIRWVQRDKLWGLAHTDGTWLVEPKFQQPSALTDGLARVVINGKVGFIDQTGNFAIEPTFDSAREFRPGVGRTSAKRDVVVGVIDKAGSWVFQTNYQQVDPAFELRTDPKSAIVFGWNFKKDGRWGLLNLDGHVVLDADFDQTVSYCTNGRLEAYKNKERFYFKADGSPLQPPDGRLVDASCFGGVPPYALKVGDKFGLVDAGSNPLTPVQFEAIGWASPDARNVKINGKWGRVGLDGRWLLEPTFDYLSNQADLFVASIDGKRGFMRSDGAWLIEPKFDAAARRPDNETAFVTVAGATGVLRLVDQSWVVSPRPGVMCDINNAIMSQTDGKRAMLSRTGETWIDIGAERIGISVDYGLLTFLKNGKWGLVDTAGKIIVEPQFDEPALFSPDLRGVAWAKRDSRWCAIDRRGHPMSSIPCADANPVRWSSGWFQCKVEP
jgi:WG containing repeat